MIQANERSLNMILRHDLPSFIARSFMMISPSSVYTNPWYAQAIAHKLQRCLDGECKRLIINIPPRYGKSIAASVAFPAYLLGLNPSENILCVSHSSELASKHARDCRSIMTSSWYCDVFPGTRLSLKKTRELDFTTTMHGGRYSTSVGGAVTGRGGNWLIVDDAMKPEEAMSAVRRQNVIDWNDNTLLSRLDNKLTGVIIVIMQRLHMDDLVGHLLGKGDEWEVLSLPAIAPYDQIIPIGGGRFYHRRAGEALDPAREPIELLEIQKRNMGSFNFSAQYQQSPIPEEGELFHWDWFRFHDEIPRDCTRIIQSWDTASKDTEISDYSVCTTWMWRGNEFYLLNVFRKKLLYPELREAIKEQYRAWKASTVLIEDKGAGTHLIQEWRAGKLGMPGYPIAIEPVGDKITRAWAHSHLVESGRIFLPQRTHWLEEFQKEILQFPKGKNDDQIDSMSQFLMWATRPQGGFFKVKLGGV